MVSDTRRLFWLLVMLLIRKAPLEMLTLQLRYVIIVDCWGIYCWQAGCFYPDYAHFMQ